MKKFKNIICWYLKRLRLLKIVVYSMTFSKNAGCYTKNKSIIHNTIIEK